MQKDAAPLPSHRAASFRLRPEELFFSVFAGSFLFRVSRSLILVDGSRRSLRESSTSVRDRFFLSAGGRCARFVGFPTLRVVRPRQTYEVCP